MDAKAPRHVSRHAHELKRIPKSEEPMTNTTPEVPDAPEGTGPAGLALWVSIMNRFELADHETSLLVQAVRVADTCEDLQAIVVAEGEMARTRLGEVKTHPALVELRNQRGLLAKLIVALRVPIGDAEVHEAGTTPMRRAQRRGTRGYYGPRAVL
jgi:hypothetical protein